jgi:hypothetical protein
MDQMKYSSNATRLTWYMDLYIWLLSGVFRDASRYLTIHSTASIMLQLEAATTIGYITG